MTAFVILKIVLHNKYWKNSALMSKKNNVPIFKKRGGSVSPFKQKYENFNNKNPQFGKPHNISDYHWTRSYRVFIKEK